MPVGAVVINALGRDGRCFHACLYDDCSWWMNSKCALYLLFENTKLKRKVGRVFSSMVFIWRICRKTSFHDTPFVVPCMVKTRKSPGQLVMCHRKFPTKPSSWRCCELLSILWTANESWKCYDYRKKVNIRIGARISVVTALAVLDFTFLSIYPKHAHQESGGIKWLSHQVRAN